MYVSQVVTAFLLHSDADGDNERWMPDITTTQLEALGCRQEDERQNRRERYRAHQHGRQGSLRRRGHR